jgi:putative MATE family efflux protein
MLRLAWPVLVSMTLHTFFNIVNAFWVGHLGPGPLASVTTSLFATWSLWAVAEMVGVGMVAIVARHVGAGERAEADRVAAQGILAATILAVVTAGLSWVFPPWLFRLLGTEPEVAREGALFLQSIFLGSISFFLLFTFEAILRAWGDTRTPMLISLSVVGLNMLLDPLLIFGPGPFPRWGVLGAGIATVAAHMSGVLIYLGFFARHRHRFPGILRNLRRVDPAIMLACLRIGSPASLNTVLFSVVYLFLSREAAQIGTGPLAALGVGNRVESVSYLTATSLSVAAATIVGQNLGAAQKDRARRAARAASLMGFAVCSFWGLLFFAMPEPILRIFASDPEVIEPGVTFLRVIALCQPFMGVEIALAGVFQGAGYTLVPMFLSAGISILRIPLAAFANRGLGAGFTGIAWVVSITCVLRALVMFTLKRRNRWLETRVRR